MTGLRINFRDRALERIDGCEHHRLAAVSPASDGNGERPGAWSARDRRARTINGAMIGVFGGGTESTLKGLGVGGIRRGRGR